MLAGSHPDLFKAISIIHPAMLDSADVDSLQVPLGLFPSKDEPEDTVKEIVKLLEKKEFAGKCRNKTYPNMWVHFSFLGRVGFCTHEKYTYIVLHILTLSITFSLRNSTLMKHRHHGWAAARADLKNEENKKAYQDVYERVAEFFQQV